MNSHHHFWPMFGHATASWVHSLDGVMVGRLLLTLLLCGVVGLERSAHERASGFRTHILVGIGACMMTLAGAYGFSGMGGLDRNPMALATYVVSGIGFLGAGAILRHGTTVRGLTTAASLWSAAGIGITVGVGLPVLASIAAGLILFTLVPLKKWEARLRLGQDAGDLAIHLRDDREAVGKTMVVLTRLNVPLKGATIIPGAGETAILRVDLARALRPDQVMPIVQQLLTLKYVSRVDTKDLNLDVEEEADDDAVEMMEYDVSPEEAEDTSKSLTVFSQKTNGDPPNA